MHIVLTETYLLLRCDIYMCVLGVRYATFVVFPSIVLKDETAERL